MVTRAMRKRLIEERRVELVEIQPPFDIRHLDRIRAFCEIIRNTLGGVRNWMRARPGPADVLYMSVNAGERQWVDLFFLCLARLAGMECWLHHHGYSYILRPGLSARLLFRAAGRNGTHIVQCRKMAKDLSRRFPGADRTLPLSNAALVLDPPRSGLSPKESVGTIGFMSNLTKEKGVEDFLDLVEVAEETGEKFRFLLAGPLVDQDVHPRIRDLEERVEGFEYVGAVYGDEKRRFFECIDVFLFPTRYPIETEGIVNLEALSAGVPVISFDRGCIGEYIDDSCGFIMPKDAPFARSALERVVAWKQDPERFGELSRGALKRYEEMYRRSRELARDLVSRMAGSV